MPVINVEGIGAVAFPDEMSMDEIAAQIEKHADKLIETPVTPLGVTQPQLTEKSTLADVIRQPTPILTPDRGGVVRSVIPGVLQPEDLKPAIRLIGGKVVEAKDEGNLLEEGPTHPDIIRQHGLEAEDIDQRGFLGPNGEFIDREAAAKATGLPTNREDGRLHSTDLIDAKEEAPQGRRDLFQAPIPPSVSEFGKQAEAGFPLPTPDERLINLEIPKDVAKYIPPTEMGRLVKFGFGPPAPSVKEEGESLFSKFRHIPIRTIFGEKGSQVQEQVERDVYNTLQSLPAFMRTEEGILATLASMVPVIGKPATSAFFTADMYSSMKEQARQLGENWDNMDAVERASGITKLLGTMGMTAMLGKHTLSEGKALGLKGIRATVDRPRPPLEVTPEVLKNRAEVEKKVPELTQNLFGRKADLTDQSLGTGKIAITRSDGSILINRAKLHQYLEQGLNRGQSVEDGIASIVNHESIHGAVRTLTDAFGRKIGDRIALSYWNKLTAAEKAIEIRRYLGANPTGEIPSDIDMGHEAIRFRLERASKMKPIEFIAWSKTEALTSRALTALGDVVRKIRETFGTDASDVQKRIIDLVQSNIEDAKKGKTSASSQQKAAKVYGDVQSQPVKGPGEVSAQVSSKGVQPPAQAVAQAAQVPLEKEKAPTEAPTKVGPPAAPAEVKAEAAPEVKPSGAAEPAISEAKPKVEKPQAPAELTPEQKDAAELKKLNDTIVERDLTEEEMARYDELMAKRRAPSAVEKAEGERKRTLTPVMLSEEGAREVGKNHAEALLKHARAGRLAFRPQDKMFLDENGNLLNRSQAAKRFEEITGRKPAIPDALTSEDLTPDIMGPAIRMKEGLPQEIRDPKAILAMPVGALQDYLKVAGISPTKAAYMLGDSINTPERANEIRQAHAAVKQEVDSLMKSGQMNAATTTAMVKGQMFSEALRMHDARNAVLAGESVPEVAKRVGVESKDLMRVLNGEMQEALGPAAKVKDMTEEQLQDYLRPMIMAAGDDAAKKQAAFDFVVEQIEREYDEEAAAQAPKLEAPIGESSPLMPMMLAVRMELDRYLEGEDLFEGERPTFKGFVAKMKEETPGATEDALRWLWTNRVIDHLINASGKRLEMWRKDLKLEGPRRYGTGPVADPLPEWKKKSYEEIKKLPPEEQARYRQMMLDDLAKEEAAIRAEQKGTAPEVSEKQGKLVMQTAERAPMSDAEFAQMLTDRKKRSEAAQKFRNRLITEINDRLVKEAIRIGKKDTRSSITPGDINFSHDKTKFGSYHEMSSFEEKNVPFLQNNLDDFAREKGRLTRTKRVTVLVNKKTGQVEIVSTYKQSKRGIMLYDPILAPGADKPHHQLSELMPQYRVKASILLQDPVDRFHMRIADDPETGRTAEQVYDDIIGRESREAQSGVYAIWHEGQMERQAAEAADRRALTSVMDPTGIEADAPLGMRPEDVEARSGELPGTQVQRGEGGLFTGPNAGTIRAQAGILRSNLKYFSRGPLTAGEAGSLMDMFSSYKVRSVADIRAMLDDIHELAITVSEDSGKRRGLRGSEYSTMSAIDKIVKNKWMELKEEKDIKNKIDELDSPIQQMRRNLEKEKNPEAIKFMQDALDRLREVKRKYLDGQKVRAMNEALHDLYAIASKHSQEIPYGKVEGFSTGRPSFDVDSFTTEALEKYGDHTRRTLRDAEAPKVSETGRELEVPALRPGVPRVSTRMLPEVPPGGRGEITPPEKMTTPASAFVAGESLARHGPQRPIPEGALEPIDYKSLRATGTVAYRTMPPPPEFVAKLSPAKGRPYLKEKKGFAAAPWLDEPSRVVKGPARGEPIRTVTEGPAAAEKSGYGPSRRVQEQLQEEGRLILLTEDFGGVSPKQAVEDGRKLIAGGFDYEGAMKHFEATGQFGYQEFASMRAHAEDLQRAADREADRNRNSPQYRAAARQNALWQSRMDAVKNKAGDVLRSMQGEVDLDTGSFSAMEREFVKGAKRAPTEREAKKIKSLTDEVNKITVEAEKSKEEQMDALSVEEEEMEPQVKSIMDEILAVAKKEGQSAWERIKARHPEAKGPAARMKGEDIKDFALVGAQRMVEMSTKNALTYTRWKKQMMKDLAFMPKEDLTDENLKEIWHEATKNRSDWIAKKTGPEKAFETVKEKVTRRDVSEIPNREAVMQEMAKIGNRTPTPKQARAIWNYARSQYLDKGITDYPDMVAAISRDLGMSMEQVHRALGANKTARRTTVEMYKKLSQQRRVVNEAKNWIKNQQYPWWQRWLRRIPRLFFVDKVFGHGYVPMVTHAIVLAFNPRAWGAYYEGWKNMYKMGLPTAQAEAFHSWKMDELKKDKNFWLAKRAGLQNDPFQYTDDFRVVAIHQWLRHFTGNRGFDSLKVMRQQLFNKYWDKTPDKLKFELDENGKFKLDQHGNKIVNMEMAKLWADSINHATGIIKSATPELANWALFAPKLELSRWAWLIRDSGKAAGIFLKWDRSTPAQRHWAISELQSKAWFFGLYATALAGNEGLLMAIAAATGKPQKQHINISDPRRGDFLAFKVAGFNVGVAGPLIGMFRAFSLMYHAARAKRRGVENLQTRQESEAIAAGRYVRGKFSPVLSFGVDVATGQDFRGTPLPWSKDRIPRWKRAHGMRRYDWGWWIGEQFAPIPAEEAIREVWRAQGMGEKDINTYLKAMGIAVATAGTGARVTEDIYEDVHRR